LAGPIVLPTFLAGGALAFFAVAADLAGFTVGGGGAAIGGDAVVLGLGTGGIEPGLPAFEEGLLAEVEL
jgi:hypothetical protein